MRASLNILKKSTLRNPLVFDYYYDSFVEHMNYKIGLDIILKIRYLYYSIYT